MGTVHSDFFAGLASLFSVFSRSVKDIAIDLGTANTLVYVRGRGIVLREPSVVAVDVRTDEVLAVGKQAKEMLGRTPDSIVAVRPLKDGVIADFEVTAAMLKYFVRKALKSGAFSRPHIVICIPSGVTEVERRAVEDAARSAGSGKVDLILEPMAAALAARRLIETLCSFSSGYAEPMRILICSAVRSPTTTPYFFFRCAAIASSNRSPATRTDSDTTGSP